MQWTVRLEVKATELATFSRPAVVSTLAEIGLVLSETKALLTKFQASIRAVQRCDTASILSGFQMPARLAR